MEKTIVKQKNSITQGLLYQCNGYRIYVYNMTGENCCQFGLLRWMSLFGYFFIQQKGRGGWVGIVILDSYKFYSIIYKIIQCNIPVIINPVYFINYLNLCLFQTNEAKERDPSYQRTERTREAGASSQGSCRPGGSAAAARADERRASLAQQLVGWYDSG